MRWLAAGTCIALGIACVSRDPGPIKTEVHTFPDGGIVEFNGQRVGRAPAAVTLPQDSNGRLTERSVLRALPNTAQVTLHAQNRVLEPSSRTERVPNRILIDLTQPGINGSDANLQVAQTQIKSSGSTGTNQSKRPRRSDRSKPTQPVGIDRWNPGIY